MNQNIDSPDVHSINIHHLIKDLDTTFLQGALDQEKFHRALDRLACLDTTRAYCATLERLANLWSEGGIFDASNEFPRFINIAKVLVECVELVRLNELQQSILHQAIIEIGDTCLQGVSHRLFLVLWPFLKNKF
jgi:hypothetical protein